MLYDKNGNQIDNINNEEIMRLVIEENRNYEDYLISTLVAICPKKIEILDSLNNELSQLAIKTIQSIFEDKVSVILKN
jgi:hypothetical protein